MTQMVKYKDSIHKDLQDIQSVCRTVSSCVKVIKVCDRLIKDHTGLRTGRRPNKHATKWEMRQALNLPIKYPVDARYTGEVDAMGNVTVIDKLSNNKVVGNISCIELDRRQMDPQYNPQAANQSFYFTSTNQLQPYKMPPSVNTPVMNIQNANQAAAYSQSSGNKLLVGLTGALAAATLVAGLVKVIDDISSKKNAAELLSKAASGIWNKVKGIKTSLFKSKNEIKASGDTSSETKDILNRMDKLEGNVNNLEKTIKETIQTTLKDLTQPHQKAIKLPAVNKELQNVNNQIVVKLKNASKRKKKGLMSVPLENAKVVSPFPWIK